MDPPDVQEIWKRTRGSHAFICVIRHPLKSNYLFSYIHRTHCLHFGKGRTKFATFSLVHHRLGLTAVLCWARAVTIGKRQKPFSYRGLRLVRNTYNIQHISRAQIPTYSLTMNNGKKTRRKKKLEIRFHRRYCLRIRNMHARDTKQIR